MKSSTQTETLKDAPRLKATIIAGLPRAEMLRQWRAEYHPCENGVHVFQPEGGKFGGITLRNFPGESLELFRKFSSSGPDDDWDLICDLTVNGDLVENVCIRRQDLELIERALEARGRGR
jgi:hypothetical protein